MHLDAICFSLLKWIYKRSKVRCFSSEDILLMSHQCQFNVYWVIIKTTVREDGRSVANEQLEGGKRDRHVRLPGEMRLSSVSSVFTFWLQIQPMSIWSFILSWTINSVPVANWDQSKRFTPPPYISGLYLEHKVIINSY